jgi:hypothetical protein
MKKLTALLLCLFAMNAVSFAGGPVFWSNISFTAMTAQTNTSTYSTFGDLPGFSPGGGSIGAANGHPPSGPAFFWELLYAPYQGFQLTTPTTMAQMNSQGWKSSGLLATNSVINGRLTPVNGNTAATVPWNAGETNSIMMVGWSANMGVSWLTVSNELAHWDVSGPSLSVSSPMFFGVSETGYIEAFNSNPGAIVFANSPNATGLPIFSLNTQLFQIVSTPEPSSVVLGMWGSIGLLVARRRSTR